MISSFFIALGRMLLSVGTFIIDRWRIFLPLAIVGLILICFFHVRSQRDDAIQALTDLKQHITAETLKRQVDNALKDQKARLALNEVSARHQLLITQLKAADDEKLKTEHRNGINTEKQLTDRIDQWRERVRLELAKNTDGLRTLQESADGSAGSGQDGNPATVRLDQYETLELACKITTADYNALWEAWDKACQVFGCKP